MADGTEPSLGERVAALEAALIFACTIPPPRPLTEAEMTGLREQLAEAAKQGLSAHRIIPQPPPLTSGQVRQLLSECVTVVKPGETLVIRVPLTWTPSEVYRYQQNVNAVHDEGLIPFKVLVIGGDELAVAEPGQP